MNNKSNGTNNKNTILRIKRRRIDPPLPNKILIPTLRQKYEVERKIDDENESEGIYENVKFKRIRQSLSTKEHSLDGLNKRSWTVVDCVPDEFFQVRKRAKVALRMTDVGVTVKKRCNRKGKLVTDPLTAMINHHLEQYHESGPSLVPYHECLVNHLEKINLCCSNKMGSILHAAALWNDFQTANYALNMGIDCNLLNGEDMKAVDVAKLAGNEQMEELIRDNMGEDFVYDLYCIKQKSKPDPESSQPIEDENEDASSTTIETGEPVDDDLSVVIQNGKSYWNQDGHLILEMNHEVARDDYVDNSDDDYDSNDENYAGNDYPEDELSDDGDQDDSESYQNTYHDAELEEIMQLHSRLNIKNIDK